MQRAMDTQHAPAKHKGIRELRRHEAGASYSTVHDHQALLHSNPPRWVSRQLRLNRREILMRGSRTVPQGCV